MTEAIEKEKTSFKRLPLDEKGNLIKNGWGIKSPRNLVIVKYPKSGSSLSLCDVPKILIGDSEKSSEYFKPNNVVDLIDATVDGKYVSTNRYGYIPQTLADLIDELKVANNMSEYWKQFNELEAERDYKEKEKKYKKLIELINKMPFPILAIDTITSLVNVSNTAALYEYNLGVKPDSRKGSIKRVDEYGGTMYIRRKFDDIKRFIENNAAPFIQFHGHIGTRKKVLKKSDEDITALDIALEGVLSTIFTSQAHAVATFYRDDEGCWLDFLKKDETDLGSRPLHLSNKKIKIADIIKNSDLEAGKRPKTYWDIIYPEISFK
jgi:hypothetical protein